MPHTNGGHVDTESGMLYRRAPGQVETKKRTPAVKLPRQLRAHLRRWERMGARHVVEIDGARVASVKTAWRTALAASGIEHCTPHDLRRTAITWAMQRGADKWAAAGFFGLTRPRPAMARRGSIRVQRRQRTADRRASISHPSRSCIRLLCGSIPVQIRLR